MKKNTIPMSECRRRLRELEQVLRASANSQKLDLQRLDNSYWSKKAEQFEQEAEILLSKARTARAKQKELEDTAEQTKQDIENTLLKAGVCKALLRLKGKSAEIVMMQNPHNSIEVYIHLMHGDTESADKVISRDIEGRTVEIK